ncbi:MAG TPA: hypothetical protein VMU34_14330, partial [Mycobacterium sp.]|nr:hypothetical protein [Mycobacterium sp.]
MTVTQLIGTLGAVLAALIAAAVVAVIRWVRKQFEPILVQLTPNGGSSAVDKINTLHAEFLDHKRDTAARFDGVDQHLDRQ